MTKRLSFLLLTVLLLTSAACSRLPKPGFPDRYVDDAKMIKDLQEAFHIDTAIVDYYDTNKTPESMRFAKRNSIIAGELALIDLHYNAFLQRLSFNKQAVDTVGDLVKLGLDLAIPLTAGETAKSTLGAVSAGVVGTKLSIDKNFFYEQTVPTLISAMNAQRKEARIPIIQGLTRSADEYPLAQALVDLNNYYFAGTFVGAMQGIQMKAGETERDADLKLKAITEGRYSLKDRDLRDRISVWLTEDTRRVKEFEAWLQSHVPPITTAAVFWVNYEQTSTEWLQAAIKYFNIP